MIYNDMFMLFFYAMVLSLLITPSHTQTISLAKPIAAPAVVIACGRSCPIFCSSYYLPCSGHPYLFFGARCYMEGGAVIR